MWILLTLMAISNFNKNCKKVFHKDGISFHFPPFPPIATFMKNAGKCYLQKFTCVCPFVCFEVGTLGVHFVTSICITFVNLLALPKLHSGLQMYISLSPQQNTTEWRRMLTLCGKVTGNCDVIVIIAAVVIVGNSTGTGQCGVKVLSWWETIRNFAKHNKNITDCSETVWWLEKKTYISFGLLVPSKCGANINGGGGRFRLFVLVGVSENQK